jgi:metal-responsive CopG/Arc/MetJ family transcriptional regulator
MLDDTLERVNISLPRRVLHRLDARAKRTGATRSGFIARMAIEGRDRALCTPDGKPRA